MALVNLGNPTWIELVSDADTPAGLQQYAGRFIAVPTNLPDGSPVTVPPGINTLRVSGVDVPGYVMNVAGSLKWMMRPNPDPVVTMFNALPGAGGWVHTAARDTWANIGLALLGKGVSGAELIAGFPALYNAAVQNYLAQHPPA